MLSRIDRNDSVFNIKQFASNLDGCADSFNKKLDVIVKYDCNQTYLYRNVDIYISYNVPYMDFKVSIIWEDDKTQIDYKSIELHGEYSSNFQKFSCNGENLNFNSQKTDWVMEKLTFPEGIPPKMNSPKKG